MDYMKIVDQLLDMKPDPIPRFVLLKEFKGINPGNAEYQDAYEEVCGHPFVREIVESQNDKGFWPSYERIMLQPVYLVTQHILISYWLRPDSQASLNL